MEKKMDLVILNIGNKCHDVRDHTLIFRQSIIIMMIPKYSIEI
jgi:hypothetical protein